MYAPIVPRDTAIRGLVKSHMHLKGQFISSTQEEPYSLLMAITMLCTVYSRMRCGTLFVSCFYKPGTSIGACSGFEVLSKSCDQQYTHIMLFRVLLTHRVANTLGTDLGLLPR